MKQFLVAISLMTTLGLVQVSAQAQHRSKLTTAQTTAVVDTMEQGVEAYSDTTSTEKDEVSNSFAEDDATTADTFDVGNAASSQWDDDDDDDGKYNPFDFFNGFKWTVPMIIIAIFVAILVIGILALPLIIAVLVLRYLLKRHNDRVAMIQKAMETGQPIPDDVQSVNKKLNNAMWREGIQNIAIGAGLFVMFGIWDAELLMGVGALMICWGVGQLVIAKTSNKNNNE